MIRVYIKHKTQNIYWYKNEKRYVSQNEILAGSLVIDCNGRDISKQLKV